MSTEMKTRTGGVLAATCLSTLVVNANTSAVSILLPAISEDTGMSVDTLQWAVTGYSLVGAAVIVTSGALGDVFGRKKVFQLGLLLRCVLRTDRAFHLGRNGDRRTHDPGCSGVHHSRLWTQPAFGGQHRRGAVAGSVALGCCGRGGRGGGTFGWWRLGGHHRMARPVLD